MSKQAKQAVPTITTRGTGGSIFVMDLPLSKHMQEQMDQGRLTVVNADGTPLNPTAVAAVAKPAKSAPKHEWVTYAIAQGGDADDANGLTTSELIAMYG